MKKNDEGNFWFFQSDENFRHKSIRIFFFLFCFCFQESADQKAIEEANAVEPAKPLFQQVKIRSNVFPFYSFRFDSTCFQLVFMLDSIEVKLEVGFGSLTKFCRCDVFFKSNGRCEKLVERCKRRKEKRLDENVLDRFFLLFR